MLIPRTVKSAVLTGALVACFAGPALAAGPVPYNGYVPPKDSLGHPDLSGIWSNATATRFERPTQFGNRLVPTPQEVAEIEGHIKAVEQLGLKPTDPKATVKDLPADCSDGRK